MQLFTRLIIAVLLSVIPKGLSAMTSIPISSKDFDEIEDLKSYALAESPCFSVAKDYYSCSQLGMKAKDVNSAAMNTRLLVRAINSGYKIKCDNTYFLEGNDGDISRSIRITGKGCFILKGAIKITTNIPDIELDGVTIRSYDIYRGKPFDESVNTAFIFPVNEDRYSIDEIVIRDCAIDNLSLIRFQNRSGDTIKSVIIDGNKWTNMGYVGMAIGSTNIDSLVIRKNKASRVKSRLFDFATATEDIVNKAYVTDNNLSNKGYFSTTTEFYAGLLVLECIEAYCDGNVVEDFLVANPKVNLYDIYCNCQNLIYTNNKKRNVLNLQDINYLCKAKSFRGEQGRRIVENNSFIVDDGVIEKYQTLISSECCIKMMTMTTNATSQQDLLSIKNNLISAQVPCSFGMSEAINVREAYIQDNTIKCSSIAGGDSYFSGNASTAAISNNKILSKDKVSSSTPATRLKSGRYTLENCKLSSFPGDIQPEVESNVRRCNLTFSYNEKASPNIALGGRVDDCTIDFQKYDLADNYNIYLAKAQNALTISNLSVKNAPTRGTLWLRYLFDRKRSADRLELKIEYAGRLNRVMIDNINHTISVSSRIYPVRDNKQSIDILVDGTKIIRLSFYGDRLGISGLSEKMKISICEV